MYFNVWRDHNGAPVSIAFEKNSSGLPTAGFVSADSARQHRHMPLSRYIGVIKRKAVA